MTYDKLFTGQRDCGNLGYATVCDYTKRRPHEVRLVNVPLDWSAKASGQDLADLAELLLSESLPEKALDGEWRNDEEWDRLVEDCAVEIVARFRWYGWSIWRAEIQQWAEKRRVRK